jgi:hypothetical protein
VVRRRLPVALAAAVAVVAAGIVVAATTIERIDGPAEPGRGATPVESFGDVATVSTIGELPDDLMVAATSAARDAGGAAATNRGASIGMVRVLRGGSVVQAAPSGFRIPMVVTAMAPAAIANVMGRDLSGVLGPDTVVMGARTAGLRGAQAGDLVELVAEDGSIRALTIAVVAPDEQVGGTELLMSTAAADQLGITRPTSVVIWGFASRAALDQALAARGVIGRHETRVARSWAPRNPDGTIGTARTKELLGEFAYQPIDDVSVIQDGTWVAANLPADRVLLTGSIPIEARCHNRIVADLVAALDDVAAAGLAATIDVSNTNTYGGCHNPRYNRISGQLGFLSRHAWAQAFDTNTVTNCQGCVPQMSCDVVRIFRRHGFAWGGNFLRPDGMHFEWVGERRDQLSYPSTYCPNVVQPTTESFDTSDSRATLFADAPDFGEQDDHAEP